jgi:phosphohistidine phosphatase SixA
MKLFVARHGMAAPMTGAVGDDQDRARRLTAAGEKQVMQSAMAMKRRIDVKGGRPRIIKASPFARTIQTAQIFADVLGLPVQLEDHLMPHKDLEPYIMDLAHDRDNKRVMLVGHHDNIMPALNSLGKYDDDDKVDELGYAEVRALDLDRESGQWIEEGRYIPASQPGAVAPAVHGTPENGTVAPPIQMSARKSALAAK